MTDKQIIIDGVDVSRCEFYKNTNWKNCYSRDYKESVCQSNHNCYYKNWQRAEQKLERIAKVCDKFIPDHFKILLIIEGGIVEE